LRSRNASDERDAIYLAEPVQEAALGVTFEKGVSKRILTFFFVALISLAAATGCQDPESETESQTTEPANTAEHASSFVLLPRGITDPAKTQL
jgi:hypothetical protein